MSERTKGGERSELRPSAGGVRAAGRDRKLGRILGAAEQLFASQGFAKTTVGEIADLAAVSKGLIYDHFGSKEELLEAVWAQQVEEWTESTQREVKYSKGAVADSIAQVLAVSVRHVRETPLLARILSQDPGSLVPHERDGVREFGRFYREMLEPVLAKGVKNRELRRDLDVERTAELVWLLHFALIRELFVGPLSGWREDGEELLRAAMALVVNGLTR